MSALYLKIDQAPSIFEILHLLSVLAAQKATAPLQLPGHLAAFFRLDYTALVHYKVRGHVSVLYCNGSVFIGAMKEQRIGSCFVLFSFVLSCFGSLIAMFNGADWSMLDYARRG